MAEFPIQIIPIKKTKILAKKDNIAHETARSMPVNKTTRSL